MVFISQPNKNPEIDEAVWKAWLQKNNDQERIGYERRLRVMAVVAVFVTLIALLWKFG
jgi:hypothetical protein